MADPARTALGVAVLGTSVLAGWLAWSRLSSGLPLLPGGSMDWRQRILEHTVKTESRGKYDAVNRNTDAAGISIGLIQWSQGGGGLPEILRAWQAADPARFERHFAGRGAALLQHVSQSNRDARLAPLDGAVLWGEPWLSRFYAALRDPVFQRVQDQVAVNGSYMRAAERAAQILGGPPTVQGLGLLYDISVQQGPGAVSAQAQAAAAALPHGSFADRIAYIAAHTAEPFRGRTAGSVDLYRAVSNRVARIMQALPPTPIA